jgi:hypothetical protein
MLIAGVIIFRGKTMNGPKLRLIARLLFQLVAFIVGVGIGISVGAAHTSRAVRDSARWMSATASVGTYAALAHLQYRYADEQHARTALSDFVNFAQQAKTSGKISDGRAFSLDLAHAYMRLAGLDRRDGNMEGYRANLSRAQEVLREFGARDNLVEDNIERFLSQDEPQLVKLPKAK